MAKTEIFKHKMKDGSIREVVGTPLSSDWHYHKERIVTGQRERVDKHTKRTEVIDETHDAYWLTHTPSGKFLTSAQTVKSLKELVNEPEFFDEKLTMKRLLQAYGRWINRSLTRS